MPYLHEILASGAIADNRQYFYIAPNLSASAGSTSVKVNSGNGSNSALKVFEFLRSTSELVGGTSARSANVVIVRPDGYEHNTDDPFISLSGFSHDNFRFSTGNLVGAITKPDGPRYTLNISSRFGDEFLKYIIADADGFAEIPDLGGRTKGDLHWLLPYLWAVKLRKAWRLGLPKLYATHTETGAQVRGRIDPLSHVMGEERANYRCTVREHSYDNAVTRLLARTMKVLDTRAFLPNASLINSTLQAATHGARHPIGELLATPPVRNPYFSAYNSVIALSKLILRAQALDVGAQAHTNALLFDVSMLFEYFVRKRLQRAGCSLHGKTSMKLVIPTGLANGHMRKLIPDLIVDAGGVHHVFDVKYKSFDFRWGVAREDLFQLHTYVAQVAAHGPIGSCGFIYPISEECWENERLAQHGGVISDSMQLGERRIPFHVFFLKIPNGSAIQTNGLAMFQMRFGEVCETFTSRFRDVLRHATAVTGDLELS